MVFRKRCGRHLIIKNNKRLQTNANSARNRRGISHLNMKYPFTHSLTRTHIHTHTPHAPSCFRVCRFSIWVDKFDNQKNIN